MKPLHARAFWLLLSAVTEVSPDGNRTDPSPMDGRTLAAAISLAKENGLYYPLMSHLLKAGLEMPPREEARWRRELDDLARFRNTLHALNGVSSAANVEYTVIKDCQNVAQIPRDVDVYVTEDQREAFIDALLSQGFHMAYNDDAETSLVMDNLLRVDLYSRIHYLGRDFVSDSFLRDSRTTTSTLGVSHPGLRPEAALLLNSAHGLFGHAALTLADFLDLRTLQREISDLDVCRTWASASGWGTTFALWIAYLQHLESRTFRARDPVRFPCRHGRRLVMQCISALDGPRLRSRERLLLEASLIWDGVVSYAEQSGLDNAVRRSGIAVHAANIAGHWIKASRGDRKKLYSATDKRQWERGQAPVADDRTEGRSL
jgi:hypothetical protein